MIVERGSIYFAPRIQQAGQQYLAQTAAEKGIDSTQRVGCVHVRLERMLDAIKSDFFVTMELKELRSTVNTTLHAQKIAAYWREVDRSIGNIAPAIASAAIKLTSQTSSTNTSVSLFVMTDLDPEHGSKSYGRHSLSATPSWRLATQKQLEKRLVELKSILLFESCRSRKLLDSPTRLALTTFDKGVCTKIDMAACCAAAYMVTVGPGGFGGFIADGQRLRIHIQRT